MTTTFVRDGQGVCPGDHLALAENAEAGDGAHLHGRFIVASTVGCARVTQAALGEKGAKAAIAVSRSAEQLSAFGDEGDLLAPGVGDTVLARIVRLNPRYASCAVACVNTAPLRSDFAGIIRTQDVRATDIDKVEILSSFRPGDIVRAEVISLGESRSLLLSTAKIHLGVLHARSSAGFAMVPIGWDAMQCPETKIKEPRKVAKPV